MPPRVLTFYVVDENYEPVGPGRSTADEAAAHAFQCVYVARSHDELLVVGMASPTFREDVPMPVFLKLTALYDLTHRDA